ncbi:AAA family ATPase [Sinorhizobium medicae]|uniref:AAA family ATPase n=1 Tax=Sinorhizobium medicae TaxID=110321 RepID=UPI0012955BEA|nr:AAA family ATPase [Sinorhizobium medicae]MQW01354.1 AAA family ATPase [Sinorhizobium medicae]
MTQLTVVISNCNSVDRAEISVLQGRLNIKYGPNGLGKSTLAKAIVSQIRGDGTLQDLVPFKSRGKADALPPSVQGIDDMTSALVFDDEYVQQFVFQKDEVLKNSFDIFIKTPDYIAAMNAIDLLLSGVKQALTNNAEIEQTISDFKELGDAFGKSKPGSIPKNSRIHKAFGTGNKTENIPFALKPFETFIKSQEPSKWIGWQVKGNDFLKLGDNCPYCSTPLVGEGQKDTALAVAKEFDATAVGHLNTLKAVIERLGKYFSEKCRENLDKVTKTKIDLTPAELSFLTGLKAEIDGMITQLEGLRAISFFSLRDVGQISEKITPLKIDLALMDKLDSAETRSITDPVNTQLEDLLAKVGDLTGQVNKHKAKIKKTIEANQGSINAFLKSAGYKYTVEIVPEEQSYKMKLVHHDLAGHLETASKHLSYGEKNAFALVLFMYQVLSENPDLVVLDDPISSFDKNKKFAILHELFQGKASLRGRTTLMLTHDIEPAIDVIKSTKDVFQGAQPSASFLSSRGGVVKEVPIARKDIQTFAKVCRANIATLQDPILKAIYLRRDYELRDEVGLEYNLLASLFKGRAVPTLQTATENRNMTPEERQAAEATIRAEHMPRFNYDALISEVNNVDAIRAKFLTTDVGYEKIQLFRIFNIDHDDDVIRKFINESYHIENEYVMQLNPHKFESIPEYVIDECLRMLPPTQTAA